jgi:hypothetical protein
MSAINDKVRSQRSPTSCREGVSVSVLSAQGKEAGEAAPSAEEAQGIARFAIFPRWLDRENPGDKLSIVR